MVYRHVVSFYAHVNNVFLCFSSLNAVSAISQIALHRNSGERFDILTFNHELNVRLSSPSNIL